MLVSALRTEKTLYGKMRLAAAGRDDNDSVDEGSEEDEVKEGDTPPTSQLPAAVLLCKAAAAIRTSSP